MACVHFVQRQSFSMYNDLQLKHVCAAIEITGISRFVFVSSRAMFVVISVCHSGLEIALAEVKLGNLVLRELSENFMFFCLGQAMKTVQRNFYLISYENRFAAELLRFQPVFTNDWRQHFHFQVLILNLPQCCMIS